MGTESNMEDKKPYTLRYGITFKCNQSCQFCNPKGLRDTTDMLGEEEIIEILAAVYENGIRKAHFTGGEPLLCNQLEEIIKKAIESNKDFEFVFTTNGTKLHQYFETFKGKVAQINFSLHSLTPEKQAQLAQVEIETVKQQIENLKRASYYFPLVKLNCTALRTVNFSEIHEFVSFCQSYNIVLRLMELHPYSISGQEDHFFEKNFVSRQELFEELKKIDNLVPTECKGDNFCVDYFCLDGSKVPLGIMYFTDLRFRCPKNKCKSIFVDARGNAHACSSQDFSYRENLAGKSFKEKIETLSRVIEVKDKLNCGDIPYPEYHVPTYAEGRGGLLNNLALIEKSKKLVSSR